MAESLRLQESDGYLIRGKEVQARAAQLGLELAHRHVGEHVTIVPVLEGARIFTGDLTRAALLTPDGPSSITIAPVDAASYKDTRSTGTVDISRVPDAKHITGRRVAVVDDIGDTYRTLAAVCGEIQELEPASLEVVVFLDRPGVPNVEELPAGVDLYVGYPIANGAFALGYGMDVNGRNRKLPFVTVGDEGADGVVRPMHEVEPPLGQPVAVGAHS